MVSIGTLDNDGVLGKLTGGLFLSTVCRGCALDLVKMLEGISSTRTVPGRLVSS